MGASKGWMARRKTAPRLTIGALTPGAITLERGK